MTCSCPVAVRYDAGGGAAPFVLAVRDAAPLAERLVWLLAPWDRARLRLTCRALAAAVPAASCAPTLAAMVRAPGGGAALLRWGAGDARPCRAHVLVAAEADALRWLLAQDAAGALASPLSLQERVRCALPLGGDAARRALRQVCDLREYDHRVMTMDLIDTGPASAAAELAAAGARRWVGRHAWMAYGVLEAACAKRMVLAVAPFLHPDADTTIRRRARLVALRLGHRALAEPCDWLREYPPLVLMCVALSGELGLADAALRHGGGRVPEEHRWTVLAEAMCAGDGFPVAIEWAVCAVGPEACRRTLAEQASAMIRSAVRADSVDALRWLTEHAGLAYGASELEGVCVWDAAACFAYLAGEGGVCVTRGMLLDTLVRGSHRTAAAAAALLGGLDAAAFVHLAAASSTTASSRFGHLCRRARTADALRRRALLPPPGPAFLRACADALQLPEQLDVLVAAGYRVDADVRTWFDSVRPHCAGTPRRLWAPLAHTLHRRYRERQGMADA